MKLNPIKTGLAVGFAFALFHLVWSLIVLLGWGQSLMDFILWAHMVHVDYVVGPFDVTACVTLLIITFLVGFVIGKVFAHIWNKVQKG